jgi:3-methylcrotonyl-CoA carboxylase beta subunit
LLGITMVVLQENYMKMENLVKELKNTVSGILQGGGEKARERHTSRKKMLPRDRINTLLDHQ